MDQVMSEISWEPALRRPLLSHFSYDFSFLFVHSTFHLICSYPITLCTKVQPFTLWREPWYLYSTSELVYEVGNWAVNSSIVAKVSSIRAIPSFSCLIIAMECAVLTTFLIWRPLIACSPRLSICSGPKSWKSVPIFLRKAVQICILAALVSSW